MDDYIGSASHKGLCIALDEVPDAVLVPASRVTGGSVTAKVVHGNDASLMIARREPGYHSKPHRHDCEQLNYVLEGEIWLYVDDGGFLARTGDAFRIPRRAIHWSRVGDGGCTLLEVHAPSLIGDETVKIAAKGLFTAAEGSGKAIAVASEWPETGREDVERRMRDEIGAR